MLFSHAGSELKLPPMIDWLPCIMLMPPIPIMPELTPIEPCIAIGLVIAISVTAGLVLDPSYLRMTVTLSLPVTEIPVICTLSMVPMPLALNIDL